MTATSTARSPRVEEAWRRILNAYAARPLPRPRARQTAWSESAALEAVVSRITTHPRFTNLAEVLALIDALQVKPSTQARYRTNIKSLWRWGGQTKRLPAPVPSAQPARLPRAWEQSLIEFAEAQLQAGHSPEVAARRVRHMRSIAATVGVGPKAMTWEAGYLHLEAAALTASARTTGRGALRAWLRWAVSTRLVGDEAADFRRPSRRLDLNGPWAAELADRSSAMRALNYSERTIATREAQLIPIARRLANTHPYEVTTDRLLVAIGQHHGASETLHGIVAAFRTFYAWAVLMGRTDDNPAERIPAIRVETKVVRAATDEEYRLALAKASEDDRLALRLAAELGLRVGEIASVHSANLRGASDDYWLTVDGKGRKQRELPISDSLAHLILARAGWAFPGQRAGHITPGALTKRLSALLPNGVTAHKLRHRFGDRAYAANRDILAVQTLLGHSSPTVTRRYVRTNDATLRLTATAVRAATPGA